MKKLIFVCCFLFSSNFLLAQKADTAVQNKPYNPILMPNVGYSLFSAGFGKVGTWIKITSSVYAEVGYSYFYNNPVNNQNEFIDYKTHKPLIGCNVYVNEAKTQFLSLSVIMPISTTHRTYQDIRLSEESKVTTYGYQVLRYSFCYGNKISFSEKKDKCGVVFKYGLMTPISIIRFIVLPFNVECSFYYTF